MSNSEDLLYTNRFLSDTPQDDLSSDTVKKFRKYIEEKREREHKASIARELSERVNTKFELDDLMNTNAFAPNSSIGGSSTAIMTQNVPQSMMPMGFGESEVMEGNASETISTQNRERRNFTSPYDNVETQREIRTRERVSLINVDSRTRDKTVFPDVNDFQINLDRTYRTIRKVRIVSAEITNDALVIDRPNNKILFADYDTPNNKEFAKEIVPGNYDVFCLVDSINTPDETQFTREFNNSVITLRSPQARFDECTGLFDLFVQDNFENPELTFTNILMISTVITYRGLLGIFGDFTLANVREFEYVRIEGIMTTILGFSPSQLNKIHEVKAVDIVTTGAETLAFDYDGVTYSPVIAADTFRSTLSFANALESAMNTAIGLDRIYIVVNQDGKMVFTVINETTAKTLTLRLSGAAPITTASLTTKMGFTSTTNRTVSGVNSAIVADTQIQITGFFIRVPQIPCNFQALEEVVIPSGSKVKIARMIPFRALFDSTRTTLGRTLGYLEEDSSELLKELKPLEITTLSTFLETNDDVVPLITTDRAHGLTTGDQVRIRINTQAFVPAILEEEPYTVTVRSTTTFTIPLVVISIAGLTFLEGQVEKLVSEQLETNVQSVEAVTTGASTVLTITGHTFSAGETVKITGLDMVPSITKNNDGVYVIASVVAGVSITIPFATTALNGLATVGVVASNRITVNHTNHLLLGNGINLIRLYGVENFGGMNAGFFNGRDFAVTFIDDDTYYIESIIFPTILTTSGGGNQIRISTGDQILPNSNGFSTTNNLLNYGYRSKQSNTEIDKITLNKHPDLSGERFIYVVSPSLTLRVISDSDTNILSNILAKVIMDVPKNAIANEIVRTDKTFIEQVLNELATIQLQLRNQDGTLVATKSDYSITLEVTELVQLVKVTAFNSQTGQIDSNVTF